MCVLIACSVAASITLGIVSVFTPPTTRILALTKNSGQPAVSNFIIYTCVFLWEAVRVLFSSLSCVECSDALAWQCMLHVFSPSESFSTTIEEVTDNASSFIARESYLQPQTLNETKVSEITFAPVTQKVQVDLALHPSSDTSSGHQETLEMQEGTWSHSSLSRASSTYQMNKFKSVPLG